MRTLSSLGCLAWPYLSALSALLILLAGCGSPRPFFAYRYDASVDFVQPAARVYVVHADRLHPGLASVDHDDGLLVEAASAHLAAAGLNVLPGAPLVAAWDRLLAERGQGFFDPDAGTFGQQAWQEHLAATCAELEGFERCDGVVLVGAVSRVANGSGTAAAWDGVKRRLRVRHLPPSREAFDFQGTLAAASVVAWVFDRQGREVLLNLGGLDPLEFFEYTSSSDVVARRRPVDLTERDHLSEALCIAFQPIVPCEAP